VSRNQETFLSKEAWMNVPWTFQPKTWRDKLYDLAMDACAIVAKDSGGDQDSTRREETKSRINQALRIEADISWWQSSWITEDYPHLQINCTCESPAPFSCICSLPASKFPTNDFAMLQAECWGLQLLISTTISKLLVADADLQEPWIAYIPLRSSKIAYILGEALKFPPFMHTAERSSGVTEGLCRAIFPAWTIRECWGIENSEPNDLEMV
jgi:hypothetical protein